MIEHVNAGPSRRAHQAFAGIRRPQGRVGRSSAWAIAAVLSVAAAGCGGGEPAASDDENPYGPLAELLGWGPESPEESRRKQLAVEDLMAECMRAEGWEYIPVDYSAQFPGFDDGDMGTDPEAFGRQYGYGVVRNYEQWEEPSLRGDEPDDSMMFDDPNMEYVSELSPSEVDEYYATLYGNPMEEPAFDGEFGDDEAPVATVVSRENMGCQGQAHSEIYGSDPIMENPDLMQRMEEHWSESQNDPRMLDAHAEWADCMGDVLADAQGGGFDGLTLDRPERMWSYMDRLKYEAMGLEVVPYREGDDMDMDFYSAWSDETGAGEAVIGQPVLIPDDELERLRAIELELWTTDWECQNRAGTRDIQRRIEEDLVAELRAEFPELGSGGS